VPGRVQPPLVVPRRTCTRAAIFGDIGGAWRLSSAVNLSWRFYCVQWRTPVAVRSGQRQRERLGTVTESGAVSVTVLALLLTAVWGRGAGVCSAART